MSNVQTALKPVRVRVVAEYSLFCEDDASIWWINNIEDEVARGISNVTSAELLYVINGPFGLQKLFFVAEFYIAKLDPAKAKKQARKILNNLMLDTDVVLHAIERLE